MAGYVNLTITSTLSSFGTERRFQRNITVLSLKVGVFGFSGRTTTRTIYLHDTKIVSGVI